MTKNKEGKAPKGGKSMERDKIISALIGLVGACGSNPKTANTDSLMRKALAFPLLCPEAGEGELLSLLEEIYREKNTVSPGCAHCACPCGNTSDYDMSRLHKAPAEIRRLKLELLDRLGEAAAKLPQEADCEIFYRGLSYVSLDLEPERLLSLQEELKAL